MFLSQLTIKNFRQFGAQTPSFSIEFHKGVTALVGENDAGKTAVIDAIRYVLDYPRHGVYAAAARRLLYSIRWATVDGNHHFA